jgi:hypothetical protein
MKKSRKNFIQYKFYNLITAFIIAEVTIIPTYDTDVLGYWVAENEDLLTELKIDLAPSASRCTINLQVCNICLIQISYLNFDISAVAYKFISHFLEELKYFFF